MSGERIEALLGELRISADPATLARVELLVEELVDLYGSGIARILQVVEQSGALTGDLRRSLAEDPLVSALLALHGLHPQDVLARVQGALERLRPFLAPHATQVSLVGLDSGVARVRIEGTPQGGASAIATVRALVERAVQEAAPEITSVELEESPGRAAART